MVLHGYFIDFVLIMRSQNTNQTSMVVRKNILICIHPFPIHPSMITRDAQRSERRINLSLYLLHIREVIYSNETSNLTFKKLKIARTKDKVLSYKITLGSHITQE